MRVTVTSSWFTTDGEPEKEGCLQGGAEDLAALNLQVPPGSHVGRGHGLQI